MKKSIINIFFIIFINLSFSNTYADESKKESDNIPESKEESSNTPIKFDLFDDDRGVEKKPEPPPVQQPPVQQPPPPKPKPPPKRLLPQKDFTLRGTSRFGEKYIAVFQTPTNKEFLQSWTPKEANIPIKLKGFENYRLLKIEPRRVHLAYPDEAPCQKSNLEVNGVECQADGSAILTLVRRQAIAAPKQPIVPVVENPTELQQKPENLPDQRRPQQPFKRRVIKDEDVPPGMRVVRTPFGDRLVPDKKDKNLDTR